VTDIKNNDFLQTEEALADLASAILHLKEVTEQKKQELSIKDKNNLNELNNKNSTINLLTESYSDTIKNIDNIIEHMNKVLEDDGTSYSNNK